MSFAERQILVSTYFSDIFTPSPPICETARIFTGCFLLNYEQAIKKFIVPSYPCLFPMLF
ncbi:hypothetical protein D7X25_01630 [bacterium 1XD42-8]|nr:hypothetical protein D7X25_01630 [bacterium 1XD42-8]